MHRLISAMVEYERGVPQRVQHLLKVYAFSMAIAGEEGVDGETRRILEAASILHDIGIRPALEAYGSAAGPYQEELGQAPARQLLEGLGYDAALIDRVVYLVGHHHSYSHIDGMDYRILVEADFLVNIFEGGMPREEIARVRENIFATAAGKRYLDAMFLP